MSHESMSSHEFRALVVEMAETLESYARRRVDAHAVDDLVAETFTLAWSRWPDLPTDHEQRCGWLVETLKHLIQRYTSTQKRRAGILRKNAGALSREDSDEDIETSTAAGEMAERILRELPDNLAVVVRLTYEGYSAREIGEMLNLKEGAVRTRLSRARELARDLRQRQEGGDE